MPETIIDIAKVSQRGSIVIPISVREHLGLNEGDKAVFRRDENGRVFLEKL